ncbi:hypothetical protein ACFQ0D_15975, partial [Micromonospora zhanjiangensis]
MAEPAASVLNAGGRDRVVAVDRVAGLLSGTTGPVQGTGTATDDPVGSAIDLLLPPVLGPVGVVGGVAGLIEGAGGLVSGAVDDVTDDVTDVVDDVVLIGPATLDGTLPGGRLPPPAPPPLPEFPVHVVPVPPSVAVVSLVPAGSDAPPSGLA